MGPRGWIAIAAATVIPVSGFVIDEHGLSDKPPALTASLTLDVARNPDPRVEQFLADVGRGEPGWTSMPGTFVEGTIHWHLSHSSRPNSCQVAVRALPGAAQRLGAITTSTPTNVGIGDDAVLNKALGVTAPAGSRESNSYQFGLTGTDGTTTFLIAYPDDHAARFDGSTASASAVVECLNHDGLFHQTRNVAGPVTTLPVSQAS